MMRLLNCYDIHPLERMARTSALVLIGLLWAGSEASFAVAAEPGKPNVVLILADNQGAWTLGCYGNPDIRTPNLDRLAKQGMRFNRAFSSNAVCSPTRATFLTGLIPSQHGLHTYLGAGGAQVGPKAYCTIAEFRSLPEVLADSGYVCGLAGKWHLGANLTPQEGFTEWTTMPHGHTTTFYDADVIEDGRIRKEPKYLTDLWTERGTQFIEKNKDRPFFLFLAYNGPYSLGGLLNRPARNRHKDEYADKTLTSFPRGEPHPWLLNNKAFLNNDRANRRMAAETSGVDDGVGEVMATLSRLGLEDDTIVIYTADQGLVAGQNGLWGMGDHTRPISAFDGMMRIPLIVRHPGHVPAGAVTDMMVSNYDLMPTLLAYLDLGDQMPTTPRSPGRDYSAALKGRATPVPWDDVVFFEFGTLRAIRTPDWKYVHRDPDGPHELYDLKSDPGEKFNLYGQPTTHSTQAELSKRLEAFFEKYADPKYDVYHGGGSKTPIPGRRPPKQRP